MAELDHRGLRNRGRHDRAVQPIGVSALANILSNKAYAGIVSWEGIEYPGLHQPLTDTATFNRVQDLLAARAARDAGAPAQPLLKGTLFCGVAAGACRSSSRRAATSTCTASARRTGTPPAAKSPTWPPMT